MFIKPYEDYINVVNMSILKISSQHDLSNIIIINATCQHLKLHIAIKLNFGIRIKIIKNKYKLNWPFAPTDTYMVIH